AELEGQIAALEQTLNPPTDLERAMGERPLSPEEREKVEKSLEIVRGYLKEAKRYENLAASFAKLDSYYKDAYRAVLRGDLDRGLSILEEGRRKTEELLKNIKGLDERFVSDIVGGIELSKVNLCMEHADARLKAGSTLDYTADCHRALLVLQSIARSEDYSDELKRSAAALTVPILEREAFAIKRDKCHEIARYERELSEDYRDEKLLAKAMARHKKLLEQLKESTKTATHTVLKVYTEPEERAFITTSLQFIKCRTVADIGLTPEESKGAVLDQLSWSLRLVRSEVTPEEEKEISTEGEELGWFEAFFKEDEDIKFLSDKQLDIILHQFDTASLRRKGQIIDAALYLAEYARNSGNRDLNNASRQILEAIADRAKERLNEGGLSPEEEDRQRNILINAELARASFYMDVNYLKGALKAVNAGEREIALIRDPRLRKQLKSTLLFNRVSILSGMAIDGDYGDRKAYALKIRDIRLEMEKRLKKEGDDNQASWAQLGMLTIIEANTFLQIKETKLAEESIASLQRHREKYEGIEFVEDALYEFEHNDREGAVQSAIQVALSELNSESLGEALGYGLGGTVGGAAVGAGVGVWFFGVGAVPGAIIGGMIGGGVGVGYLKVRNLIRGWDKIGQAYDTGLNNISWQQSLMDSVCLGLDAVSIIAPFKGASAAFKGGEEALMAELKAGGKEFAEVMGEKELKAAIRKVRAQKFVQASSRFGGRTSAILSATGVAFPVGSAAYQIITSDSLTAEQKIELLKSAGSVALEMAGVATLYIAAHYTINRLASDPFGAIRDMRRAVRKLSGSEKGIHLEGKPAAIDVHTGKAESGKGKVESGGEGKAGKASDDIAWMEEAYRNAKEPNRPQPLENKGGGQEAPQPVDTDIGWMEEAFKNAKEPNRPHQFESEGKSSGERESSPVNTDIRWMEESYRSNSFDPTENRGGDREIGGGSLDKPLASPPEGGGSSGWQNSAHTRMSSGGEPSVAVADRVGVRADSGMEVALADRKLRLEEKMEFLEGSIAKERQAIQDIEEQIAKVEDPSKAEAAKRYFEPEIKEIKERIKDLERKKYGVMREIDEISTRLQLETPAPKQQSVVVEERPLEVEPVREPVTEEKPLVEVEIDKPVEFPERQTKEENEVGTLKPHIETETERIFRLNSEAAKRPFIKIGPSVDLDAALNLNFLEEPARLGKRKKTKTAVKEKERKKRRRRRGGGGFWEPLWEDLERKDYLWDLSFDHAHFRREGIELLAKDRIKRYVYKTHMEAKVVRKLHRKSHNTSKSIYSLNKGSKQAIPMPEEKESSLETEYISEGGLVEKYYFVQDEE
ncbi:MAG: hypothetical protein D6808_08035, partial [Candidatus Dadabacteria bacterium]